MQAKNATSRYLYKQENLSLQLLGGQTRWDSWVENKAVGLYSLKNLNISLTIQRNSTAVTTFELHINEEVDNDNKLYKWYERSMVRTVYGTNSPWYE